MLLSLAAAEWPINDLASRMPKLAKSATDAVQFSAELQSAALARSAAKDFRFLAKTTSATVSPANRRSSAISAIHALPNEVRLSVSLINAGFQAWYHGTPASLDVCCGKLSMIPAAARMSDRMRSRLLRCQTGNWAMYSKWFWSLAV
ncbi:hypothetical protein D3C77_359860 [compost metagenome]